MSSYKRQMRAFFKMMASAEAEKLKKPYQKKIDAWKPEKLIEEYKLIQKKESGLSRAKREYVKHRVNLLIEKGHLTEEMLKD